jgi:hypothetical protein
MIRQPKPTQAKVHFGLIAQRSVVQIHPPQPSFNGGAGRPDFIGRRGTRAIGKNFDTTTLAAVDAHMRRPGYGTGLNINPYPRPDSFTGF